MQADLFQYKDTSNSNSTLNSAEFSPIIGHQFSQNILFNSKFTFVNAGLTHHAAGSEPKGSALLEFAYLDFFYKEYLNIRVGQQLIPVGLNNQRQDPNMYPNVFLPDIETLLIPKKWSENGLTLWGKQSNFRYQFGVFNSLAAKNFTEGTFISNGKQNAQVAASKDVAFVARLNHHTKNILVGLSVFSGKTSQEEASIGDELTTLGDFHLDSNIFRWLSLQSVYAIGKIGNADSISLSIPGEPTIASKVSGYYNTLIFHLDALLVQSDLNKRIDLFLHQSRYNLNEEVSSNGTIDPSLNVNLYSVGLRYSPIQDINFKLQHQNSKNKNNENMSQFGFGMSLAF